MNFVELDDDFFVDGNLDYMVSNGELHSTIRLRPPKPELEVTKDQLQAALERQEFLEDCLAELINEVYSE